MRDSLKPGLKHSFTYVVPVEKTVPHIFAESPEMRAMPPVFATGFMIALMEWTCIQLLAPHLDEGEGSLGVHVDISHTAPTPAGFPVTVEAELTGIEERSARFGLRAHDGIDTIGEGRHTRYIVSWDRFQRGVAGKIARFKEDSGS